MLSSGTDVNFSTPIAGCYRKRNPAEMSSLKESDNSMNLHHKLNIENDHFLWLGDFGTLKQVIAELLGIDEDAAECGSDTAHNTLSYKADKVTVKWYKTTHRLVLQGPDHKLLSEKLLKLVEEREMADTVIVDLSDRMNGTRPF